MIVDPLPDKMEWDYEALINRFYQKIQELIEAVDELDKRIKKIESEGE